MPYVYIQGYFYDKINAFVQNFAASAKMDEKSDVDAIEAAHELLGELPPVGAGELPPFPQEDSDDQVREKISHCGWSRIHF